MVDVGVLAQIAQYGPLAIVAAVVALLAFRVWNGVPAFMAQWLEFRKARAAEKAADWTRLREEVDRYLQRLQSVEEREDECRRLLADATRRIGELEGYMIGQGHARQEAQNIVSAERLSDKAKDGDK